MLKTTFLWRAGLMLFATLAAMSFLWAPARADGDTAAEAPLITGHWLSDRVLIVEGGDTFTDMVAAIRTARASSLSTVACPRP